MNSLRPPCSAHFSSTFSGRFPPLFYSWESDAGQLSPSVLVQQRGSAAAEGIHQVMSLQNPISGPKFFGCISLPNRSDQLSRLPSAVTELRGAGLPSGLRMLSWKEQSLGLFQLWSPIPGPRPRSSPARFSLGSAEGDGEDHCCDPQQCSHSPSCTPGSCRCSRHKSLPSTVCPRSAIWGHTQDQASPLEPSHPGSQKKQMMSKHRKLALLPRAGAG